MSGKQYARAKSLALFLFTALLLGMGTTHADPAKTTTHWVVETHNIVYSVVDGKKLTLDAYIPQGTGPFPAIVMIHGGGWKKGNKSFHRDDARYLARHGFSVFSINYRLAPKHRFPACIEDCKTAICWVRSYAKKYKVDVNKVGTFGHSAGGHLSTLMASTPNHSTLKSTAKLPSTDTSVQAAAAMAGVYDLRYLPSKFIKTITGKSRFQSWKMLSLTSPIVHAKSSMPPTLILNGDKDWLVPPTLSRVYYLVLRLKGVKAKFQIIKNTGHIYQFRKAQASQVQKNLLKFFTQHLKTKTAVKATTKAAKKVENTSTKK